MPRISGRRSQPGHRSCVQPRQRAIDGMRRVRHGGPYGRLQTVQGGGEQPLVQLCAVDRHAVPEIRQRLAMPPVDLPDHTFAAHLAQIVRQPCRCALRGLHAKPVHEHRPEFDPGKRLEGEPGTPESFQEPHRPRRAEPETGDALPSMLGGSDQPLGRDRAGLPREPGRGLFQRSRAPRAGSCSQG